MSETKVGIVLEAKDNATKSLKNVEKSLEGMSDTFDRVKKAATVAIAATAATLTAVGTYSFKMASDMNESLNKVDVAFKDNADGVKNWADSSLKSFGIAKGTALDMASTFGDMATGMGFNTEQAAGMSESLVGLAGDLSSFKNISIDMSKTALTSVFTGETESLKQLGIVMTQTNLEEYARANGIKKTIAEMTQAEQVQLRYHYVMAMTTNAQGDFSRTSNGAANQMRMFSEGVKELASNIGNVLLPVITPMIQKANEIVSGLTKIDFTPVNKSINDFKQDVNSVLGIFDSLKLFIATIMEKLQPVMILAQGVFASFTESLKPAWEELQKAYPEFEKLIPYVKQLAEGIGIVLVGAIIVLIGIFAGLVNGLAKSADDIAVIFKGILEVFNGFLGFIQNIFTLQFGAAFDSWNMMIKGFDDISRGTFNGIMDFLLGFVSSIIAYFQGLYDTMIGHSIIPDLVNGIKNWFAKLPGMVLDGIKSFVDTLQGYFNVAKDGIINAMNSIYSEVASIVNKIKSAMSSVQSAWSNAGSNISWALSGARAAGGPVSSGGSYLVGENGPEVFTPARSGYIIPNSQVQAGGTVIFQFYGNYLSEDVAVQMGDIVIDKLGLNIKN